jgi:pimeloyl-ACP methyl ester carboxylesterase
VPRSAGDAYKAALRDATLTVLPDAGHYVEMEQPDAVARLVADFVRTT